MRISAKGEHAAKAVLHLSLKYPEVVTTHEVARRHHIPLKYLEHILLELKKAGLLVSRRGVRGGYTLARPPHAISVGEVLRVVDGKFSQASCTEDDVEVSYACPTSDSCGLKQVWQEVQLAMGKILFETTFVEGCSARSVHRSTPRWSASSSGVCRKSKTAEEIAPPPSLSL